MISLDQIKQFKRYEKLKDSGIEWLGEIPRHWNLRKLKWISRIQPSNVDKKTREDEEPILLCNYTDVYYNEFITENIDFMQASASDSQIRKFKLEAGDTIITKDSETPKDIAVPAYVPSNLPDVICGYHLAQIKPSEELVLGEFIFRCFQSISILDQYSSRANGITRFGLTVNAIGEGIFPLPPIEEQLPIIRYIGSETSRLDQLITNKQRLIELLQEKRQALITQAVTKGLDPTVPMKDSGVEWLREIPGHWKLTKIKYVSKVTMGQSPSSEFYNDEYIGIPFIQGKTEFGEYSPKDANTWTSEASKFSEQGDILLTVRAPVGAVNVSDRKYAIGRGLCSIRPMDIDHDYFYYLLYISNQELARNATGTTYLAISVNDVANLKIPVPPNNEASKISDYLNKETSKLDQITVKLTKQIELIEECRQTLITDAVTGKIDVRGEGN